VKCPSCEVKIMGPSCEVSCEVDCEVSVDVDVSVEVEEPEDDTIPDGCADWGMVDDEMEQSETQADWRCAGNPCTTMEFGFELTQDEPEAQQGHVLCRVPFETKGSEIHALLEYVVETESEDSVGEGFTVYILDPAIRGWDREFEGTGPIGYKGKKAAVLGVAVDLTGNVIGEANHVAILSADGTVLHKAPMGCDIITPMCIDEDGDEVNEWRKMKIKFNVENQTCTVNIAGNDLLTDVSVAEISLPGVICMGVVGGSNPDNFAHICVNDISLIDEDQE